MSTRRKTRVDFLFKKKIRIWKKLLEKLNYN